MGDDDIGLEPISKYYGSRYFEMGSIFTDKKRRLVVGALFVARDYYRNADILGIVSILSSPMRSLFETLNTSSKGIHPAPWAYMVS